MRKILPNSREQIFGRLEQIIEDLALLMGNANKDCEEKRNLPEDLCRGKPNPRSILEFDEILFYDGRFSKKRFIKWLVKLEAYFYFNKAYFHQKVGLIVHKLYYNARKLWFEFLHFKTRIGMPLISSWQDLRQSLILELI
jgi:hypothetical protein